MSLVASYPFTDFSGVQGVSGNGQVLFGSQYPQGIPRVLTIENGVMCAYLTDSHAITTVGHRTEMYLTPDSAAGEVWYAWEFMLPSQYWEGFSVGSMTIGQFHDTDDVGDAARQPNFMVQTYGKDLCIVWPSATLPTESVSYTRIPVARLEYDTWHSICARINWQITTAGFREVFVDRIPVYREWGVPTAYDDVVGPWFKLGIYNTSGGLSGEKLAYFRNLTRWSGNNGYQDVMGGTPTIGTSIAQL